MAALSQDRQPWIALTIGNSCLHWFYYLGPQLQQTWTTQHLSLSDSQLPSDTKWQQWSPALGYHQSQGIEPLLPSLWVASVVPAQTQIWQNYPRIKILTGADIPLHQPYMSFGLDRALAVWTAGSLYGWPVLVVDGGTALTFTGAVSAQECLGGCIVPGLGLQLRSLSLSTANLPKVPAPEHLPPRWARDTTTAIQSGVLYALTAGLAVGIGDWMQRYPHSQLVITGGEGQRLKQYLQEWYKQQKQTPAWLDQLRLVPTLLAQGMQRLRQQQAKMVE
ncbi:MAG: pantothenate kinase [Acaryochloridaceae cyanobacterium SU_2_1]|nr:pantothenate kinase [Acaryochloridaceae cyanobacterium SU_2_1]